MAAQFARVARAFGWSHDQMMSMRVRTFNAYFKQIDRLEAREELLAFRVARIAQADKGPMREFIRELQKRVHPDMDHDQGQIIIATNEDLDRVLGRR